MSLFDTSAPYPAGPARRPLASVVIAALVAGSSHFRRKLRSEAAAPAPRDRRSEAEDTYLRDIGVEIGF